MVLGFAEDFTSNITLDSELKALPSSGIYVNSGVHPSISLSNLLSFLPKTIFNFNQWSDTTDYGIFAESRNRSDIVSKDDKVYQSIKGGVNNDVSDTNYWLETNIESLRLKIFLQKVEDRVYSDLNLNKRLVNNQYLYEDGDLETELLNDYSGWVITPKGSDYISFKVNEISLQKNGDTPVNLYVLNQKTIIDTIEITPNNGQINFQPIDLTLRGKGEFKLVIDSTDVYTGNSSIDLWKFNGFTAMSVNGTGDAPETSTYTYSTMGNGIGLNLTAFLDSEKYIENNLDMFGNYIRATFELMAFEMFLHNSYNRSNDNERIQLNEQYLIYQTTDMKNETAIRKYHREKKRVIDAMQKTFDTQLNNHDKITVKLGSY